LPHQREYRKYTRDHHTAGDVTPSPDAHTRSFPGSRRRAPVLPRGSPDLVK
jgi:hypothetical protein